MLKGHLLVDTFAPHPTCYFLPENQSQSLAEACAETTVMRRDAHLHEGWDFSPRGPTILPVSGHVAGSRACCGVVCLPAMVS